MKLFLLNYPLLHKIIRYSIVGVLSNLLGYLVYLLITFFWLEPKVAISFFYPIGATIAYFNHSKYSFSYRGKHSISILKYALVYFMGYVVNFMMLYFFSDYLKFPHQAVQMLAIFVVGGLLFVVLNYAVFPSSTNRYKRYGD